MSPVRHVLKMFVLFLDRSQIHPVNVEMHTNRDPSHFSHFSNEMPILFAPCRCRGDSHTPLGHSGALTE